MSDERNYQRAVAFVISQQKASVSLVQRHLQIGYSPAARLMERMVAEGICTEPDKTGARRVLKASP